MSTTGVYADGPSVDAGTSGTFYVSGTVTFATRSRGAFAAKLWDGATVIASTTYTSVARERGPVSLSGFITNPAGNLGIPVAECWLAIRSNLQQLGLEGQRHQRNEDCLIFAVARGELATQIRCSPLFFFLRFAIAFVTCSRKRRISAHRAVKSGSNGAPSRLAFFDGCVLPMTAA
ncbi:hypothetical protein [Bradyrhizobium sp. CCGE-LA001]|uniref:hypothetical protein n=1 Tax=Bradyrhizobium sp. CCGE-LA001 TaxID=1223566 RepID=UPI00119825D7|nr:hypothetical protein [Bradyrhizobium sp. CCGE-LA001]